MRVSRVLDLEYDESILVGLNVKKECVATAVWLTDGQALGLWMVDEDQGLGEC